MNLAEKHKETLMMIENLQARVLDDELIRWKREQQLAGNGVPFHSNLDSIQVTFSTPKLNSFKADGSSYFFPPLTGMVRRFGRDYLAEPPTN